MQLISINTDVNSLLLQNHLNTATNAVSIALQRMSTGYKINSAKDDAAGMFVASRLSTQINGIKQAQKNVADGISLLSTAEGAFSNAADILNRLRDLSVQASNGIYSTESRAAMQSEADELLNQLAMIQYGTDFNGVKIFNNETASAAVNTAATYATSVSDLSQSLKPLSDKTFEATGGGY